MEDKKTNGSAPTDRAESKSERIEKKSERIRQRGEAIAKKNGTYTTAPADKNEPVDEIPAESGTIPHSAEGNVAPPVSSNTIKGNNAAVIRKSSSFSVAAMLSAIAIILLLALTAGLMFGLIPTGGNGDVSYIQISNGSSQKDYDDDSDMIDDFLNSVVVVSVERAVGTGTGTGVILTENGYIVTNYHVVEETTNIYVKLYGTEQNIKAKLVAYKEHDDIAVLKIEKTGLRPATFVNDCSTCKVGQRVYAVGAPEGTDYSWSVTQGIVSSINRELKIYDNDGTMEKKMRMIQTDAPVNPGNSGGPLINAAGEVIGIVTMKLENSAGMGFALPSDGVLPIITAIIKDGNADSVTSTISSGRPLMGITCVSVQKNTWYKHTEEGIEVVDEAYASNHPKITFFAREDGVYVKFTSEGMDAHGKLKAGDIITKINGTRVYTQYQLMGVLNNLHGGDKVTLTFYRGGDYYDVSITLKEAPIQ